MSEYNLQQKLIQEFNNCVGVMRQNLSQKNVKQLQAQISKTQQRGKELLEQIQNRFRTIKFPIQDRSKVQKLQKDFEQIATDFQKMCDAFLQIKKQDYEDQQQNYKNSLNLSSINASVVESYQEDLSFDAIEQKQRKRDTTTGDIEKQQQEQNQVDVPSELLHQLDLVKEKNIELKKVQKDIHEIAQIMNDVGRLVNEQGQQIDEIGENTKVTKENVIKANKELILAKDLSEANKKRKCYLIILLLVIICIIVVPVIIFS